MEIRSVNLPSGNGLLVFPIKCYMNRKRAGKEKYKPDYYVKNNFEKFILEKESYIY